jgi:hypothetical protein
MIEVNGCVGVAVVVVDGIVPVEGGRWWARERGSCGGGGGSSVHLGNAACK